MKADEVWKVTEDNANYEISSYGKLRNIKTGCLLKGNTTKGYRFYVMNINGIQKTPKAHKLVAKAFLPNPNNYPCINHIDGNPSNNHVENLEWCTYSYNSKHSYKLGLQTPRCGKDNHMFGKYGKDNVRSKPVNMFTKNGELIKTFEAVESAVRWLKCSGHEKANSSCVVQNCNGIRYKSAYGYVWRYERSVLNEIQSIRT